MRRRGIIRSLAYAAVFVFFTLLFLVFNYPSDLLLGQVNGWLMSVSEGTLTAGKARIKPPFMLHLDDVSFKSDDLGSVDVGEVNVKPRILKLVSGSKSANIRVDNPWLQLKMRIISSEGNLEFHARDAMIDLAGLPEEIMTLPVLLEGELNISLILLSSDPNREISEGNLQVRSGPINVGGDLLGALGFSPLRISGLTAVATITDNVLKLGENGIDGDISAAARGEIRISPANYMSSRLDLTLDLKSGPGKREQLAPVFALLGARTGADGGITIRVRGTVEQPSITM